MIYNKKYTLIFIPISTQTSTPLEFPDESHKGVLIMATKYLPWNHLKIGVDIQETGAVVGEEDHWVVLTLVHM